MKIAVIHSLKGGRYASYLGSFIGKNVDVLSWRECLVLLNSDSLPEWDLVHVRFGGLGTSMQMLKALAIEGYTLVNQPFTVEHATNKYLGIKLARKKGIPTPKTYLVDPRFDIPVVDLPVIAKPLMSSEGKDVFIVNRTEEFENLPFSQPYILQEMVDFTRLVRAVVVGEEVIDAAYDSPTDGFRARVCMNPLVKKVEVTEELKEFSIKVAEAFRGEILVVDAFLTKDGLVFNEVNNACNLYPMQQATGVNHAKIIAEYLLRRGKK